VEIIFLDTDAGGDGTLVFERNGRRILERNAGGVKQRDFILGAAALLLAGEDFADFAGDAFPLKDAPDYSSSLRGGNPPSWRKELCSSLLRM
jgi:hypothetical protein